MLKKITAFMMGLGLLVTSGLALQTVYAGSFSKDSAAKPTLDVPNGFSLNENNTQGIAIAGAGSNMEGKLINVVKSFINWVLGILGLITLVLLLWGGFQMVTAAGDDKKFGAGQTILKHAAIGLAFIALSWLMVSLIFFVITTVGWGVSETKT